MKINQAGAHLDHFMRQTRIHHVQLSMMADVKANSLMTMAAVMMTLSAPYLVNAHFQSAVVVLISFSLLTILLASLAVMPRTPFRVKPSETKLRQGNTFNLLFFGDFVQMEQAEFEAQMEAVMNDPSACYEAQVREVYLLGSFLAAKKYRLLRCAYIAFLAGLFISGGVLLVKAAFV
jgi:hypothetical protein